MEGAPNGTGPVSDGAESKGLVDNLDPNGRVMPELKI